MKASENNKNECKYEPMKERFYEYDYETEKRID